MDTVTDTDTTCLILCSFVWGSYLSLLNLREWRMAGLFCLRFHRWTLSSARALTSAPCHKRRDTTSIYIPGFKKANAFIITETHVDYKCRDSDKHVYRLHILCFEHDMHESDFSPWLILNQAAFSQVTMIHKMYMSVYARVGGTKNRLHLPKGLFELLSHSHTDADKHTHTTNIFSINIV